MKKLLLLFVISTSVLLWSCGNTDSKNDNLSQKEVKSEKETEKAEPQPPEGYPSELTIPPGFRASQINPGEGSTTSADGDITFKSYEIWQMLPKNYPEITSHYKALMTELEYDGEWTDNESKKSSKGVFTKGNNELELTISKDKFKFYLKVWDK